jgi:hypothetical protein
MGLPIRDVCHIGPRFYGRHQQAHGADDASPLDRKCGAVQNISVNPVFVKSIVVIQVKPGLVKPIPVKPGTVKISAMKVSPVKLSLQ